MFDLNAPGNLGLSKTDKPLDLNSKEMGRYKSVQDISQEPSNVQQTPESNHRYAPKQEELTNAQEKLKVNPTIDKKTPDVDNLSKGDALKKEIKRLDEMALDIDKKINAPVDMNSVMSDPSMRSMLRKQLEKELSAENLDFLESIEQFDRNPSKEGFKEIYDKYVGDNADKQVNIPSDVRKELDEKLKSINTNPEFDLGKGTFEKSRQSVSETIEMDSLGRLKADRSANLKEEKIAVVAQSDTLKSQFWKNQYGPQQLVADFERVSPLGERTVEMLNNCTNDLDNETKKRWIFKSGKEKFLENQKTELNEVLSAWESVQVSLRNPDTPLDKARTDLANIELRLREVINKEDPKTREQHQVDKLKNVALEKGQQLASGNFGIVHKLNASNGMSLVGKSPKVGKEKDFLEEAKQEASVYAKVGEHPNIAKCYGIQEVDGKDTLVLENVEGGKLENMFSNLEKAYSENTINREEYVGAVQHLIKGSLKGLAQFETMGMVHKDIKSDNIMFDNKTMQAKLVDMGLAQEVGKEKNGMAFPPNMTPEYYALESDDVGRLNKATDSYGVGRMLYPLMEKDPDFGDRHFQFQLGGVGEPGYLRQGAIIENSFSKHTVEVNAETALEKTPEGEHKWQAIKPRGVDEGWTPGTYGAKTSYVDFMNQLTHPDHNRRLSPSDALRHPFMTESFGGEEQIKAVLRKIADANQKPNVVNTRPAVSSNAPSSFYTSTTVDNNGAPTENSYEITPGENDGTPTENTYGITSGEIIGAPTGNLYAKSNQ